MKKVVARVYNESGCEMDITEFYLQGHGGVSEKEFSEWAEKLILYPGDTIVFGQEIGSD